MLILVIFCQYIFNNVSFHFVHFILRRSYLKPERSENISRKMFSLVLCDPDKVFQVFVDIHSTFHVERSLLGPGRSIIVKCLFFVISYCNLLYFLFVPYSSFYFLVRL